MGEPNGIEVLIERHAPELRYHPLEAYRADSAATMTDQWAPSGESTRLFSGEECRDIAMAKPVGSTRQLSLGFLTDGDYWEGGPAASEEDFLDVRDSDRQEDSQAMHSRPGYGDLIYAHWHPRKDDPSKPRWLQYWFFYYFNPFRLGNHEGDWEGVRIELDDEAKPIRAVYNVHNGEAERLWPEVPTADDANEVPIVYVARGSHASYFRPGRQPRILITRFWDDHTSDAGEWVRPRVHLIDPDKDRWAWWKGRWGGSGSPQGPSFKNGWRNPDNVVGLSWVETVALEDEPQPLAPELRTALIEGDKLTLSLAFASWPADGESEPTSMEVALYGVEGLPQVRSYDVRSLEITIQHPLPKTGGPYRLHVGVYDENGGETLLDPVDVGLVAPARSAALADDEAVRPSTARIRSAAPSAPTDPVRVNVRAPDDRGAARELNAAVGRLGAGQGAFAIAPLFPGSDGDPEMGRWFTISGPQAAAGADVAAPVLEAADVIARELGSEWLIEPELPIESYRVDGAKEPREAALAGEPDDHTWALERTECIAAWELPHPNGAAKGAGIVIGQPDTGYTGHPELDGSIDRLRAWDILRNRPDALAVLKGFPPLAFPSHGTGTASVAASRVSGLVQGAAPEAKIVPIRAASTVVHFFNGDLAVAVERLRRLEVGVITISLGGIGYPTALRAAIQRALADGIIVMAAAGQPLPIVVEPARFPECIGVGGTTKDNEAWPISARGSEVDFSAPAAKVWVASTTNEGEFECARHSGTSFSVAISAGVAALWLAHHGRDSLRTRFPGARMQEAFRSLVRKSIAVADATPGWNTGEHGAGIINARALLEHDLDDADTEAPIPEHDRLQWLFDLARRLASPEAALERIEERIRGIFGGDDEKLERNARELAYRLSETPTVRAEVLEAGPDAALAEDDAIPALRALASPGMLQDLA